MALNKQKILSELGSVVNQLQSAECGCMGKLFSDPGNGHSMDAPSMHGGCRMGCCHGYGSPCSGDTCTPMNNQFMHRPFLGNCNPPRLYADTYNYLNENLMQPVVNEVYNDLKTISPDNTIMNNSMASQMGLSPSNGGELVANPNLGSGMSAMSPVYQTMGQINQPMGQMNQPMGQMNQPMGQINQSTGQMPMNQMSQPMGQMNQPVGHMESMGQTNQSMSGMGGQIMKMIMGNKSAKPANMPIQNGQLTDSMIIDAPQSPHGHIGVTPLNPLNYGAHATPHNMNYEQDKAGGYVQNPTTQYMSHSNSFSGQQMTNAMPQNMFQNNSQHKNLFSNNMNLNPDTNMALNQSLGPGAQPIANSVQQHMFQNNSQQNNLAANNINPNPRNNMAENQPMGQGTQSVAANKYGHHSQGIKKFNEMFPGVMQGNLGFDPMAIAIQMNPANQQQVALSTMEKLMNGNKPMNAANSNVMQSLISPPGVAMNQQTAVTPVANQQVMQNQAPFQNQLQPVQQQQQQLQQQPQQPQHQQQQHPQQQQQVIDPNTGAPIDQVPQQQIYNTTEAPVGYQQPSTQQYQQQPQLYHSQVQKQHQIIDPNTEAVMNTPNLATGYKQDLTSHSEMQQGIPQADTLERMVMEPIFPADTKNKAFYSHQAKRPTNYYYNTLGQPIHMVDAKIYRPEEPPLPQTLSPQSTVSKPRSIPGTFSNVKNTVSKTSIIGNGPVGRTPSRNQLQHLYNQYKGSHSLTQQNINAPIQHHSQSEGRLNENANPVKPHSVPVEKFGGDTIANNVICNQEMTKLQQPAAPMGDVMPAEKPQGDGLAEKAPPMGKGRNGLQDMVYTSYPTSAAWSFHGHDHIPYSTGCRLRSRVR